MRVTQGKKLFGLSLVVGLLGVSACFFLPSGEDGGATGDLRAPTAAITAPADGFATDLTTLLITGTAADPNRVATVVVFGCRDGGTPEDNDPCYPQRMWAGKLMRGKNDVVIGCRDPFGAPCYPESHWAGKPNIQPVTATSLTDNFETWSATLEFFGGGGQILDYTIRVATIDDQGNSDDEAASIVVSIDLSGPDIFGPDLTVLAPREGQVIGAGDVPVSGTARDVNNVASVTVDPGTGPVAATDLGGMVPYSFWRAEIALAAGANAITVIASDDQVPANTTTVVVNVTQDELGNMAPITTPSAVTLGYNGGSAPEQPEHTVNLSDYYLDQFEVTLADYKLCYDLFMCPPIYNEDIDQEAFIFFGEIIPLPGREKYPVRTVSHEGAGAFCQWNGGKRLPTEAEWERAARAGSVGPAFLPDGRLYPGGNTLDCAAANIQGCVGHVVAVGGYPANPLGIYDLAGNVMEWVQDFYQDDFYSGLKPLEPVLNPLQNDGASSTCVYSSTARYNPGDPPPYFNLCFVNRGGGYTTSLEISRSTFRNYFDGPESWEGWDSDFVIGFRCAADAP